MASVVAGVFVIGEFGSETEGYMGVFFELRVLPVSFIIIVIGVFFGKMLYDPFGVSEPEVCVHNKIVVDPEDVVCRREAMSHGGMELLLFWGGGR